MFKRIRIVVVFSLLAATLLGGYLSPAAARQATTFDQRDHPIFVIASYYDAINQRDYARAYGYWRNQPPNGDTLQQFAQGFADLQSVRVLAHLPVGGGVAAGTGHADVPVIVIASLLNGTEQIYAGCFRSATFNVPVGNPPVIDPNWYLSEADLQLTLTVDFAQAINTCSLKSAFPTGNEYGNQQTPVDLVSSYYDAIASADYVRAYNYWSGGPPGQTLQQFIQGFAGTNNIDVWLPLTFQPGVAAGSIYFDMKIVLTATSYGVPQFFRGCLAARKSGDAAIPPDPNWYFHRANLTATATLGDAVAQAWNECEW